MPHALAKLLKNTAHKTWHPILFLESNFPVKRVESVKKNVIRFVPKYHRKSGFINRHDAQKMVDVELLPQAQKMGYTVHCEFISDIIWDGKSAPNNIEFREKQQLISTH